MKKALLLLSFVHLLAACTNDIEILPNDESSKAHRQRSDKRKTKRTMLSF